MPLPRTRATEFPRRLTALGLAAWLAGAGCLLGCSAATASAHHAPASSSHAAEIDPHTAAQADSCAAMQGHDCCDEQEAGEEKDERSSKVEGERSSAGVGRRSGRTAMHCPLGGRHTSDPARKVRVDTTPAAARPATQSPAPESVYAAPAHAAGVLVRDRGSTYLRCCVFLI